VGLIGEVRLAAFSTLPNGWAVCDGRLMSIQQNQALFSVLGIVYGGDGLTTFALPDLRGRVPIHQSNDFPIGSSGGSETSVLVGTQIPSHAHALMATTAAATTSNPAGAVMAAAPATLGDVYAQSSTGDAAMPSALAPPGNPSPHANMQPFLVVNYIICLQGIFPERDI
jgi:microcystin-dependent protein